MPDPRIVTYVVDADDNLAEVNEAWSQFAELNGAGDFLKPDNVIGKSLWSFVRGKTLVAIYERLLERVRSNQDSIEFSYRCDSPSFRRYMRMNMVGGDDGIVLFQSQTVKTEPLDHHLGINFTYYAHKLIKRCSCCNLYEIEPGRYCEIDQLVIEDDLLNTDAPLKIIWSVCADCQSKMRAIF